MIDIKNDSEIKEFIKQVYLSMLEREPDYDGLHFYFQKIKNQELKIEQIKEIILESNEYKQLQENKKIFDKISDEVNEILKEEQNYDFIEKSKRKKEPEKIFVSCYNGSKNFGGVYSLEDDILKPIFEGSYSTGLVFDKENNILFALIDDEKQIRAYKTNEDKEIPIVFQNYQNGFAPHGLFLDNDKIFVIATEGDKNSKNAENKDIGKKVGKIIVSKIEVSKNEIIIKDSEIINPFSCFHHHHINELCKHGDDLIMTSFSFCNKNKKYFKRGAISKLNQEDYYAEVIMDSFTYPHSPVSYRDRLFLCSSGNAMVFSVNLKDKSSKLEYKGVDSHVRGLLITDNFMYIGINYSIGRTESQFKNPTYGILQFNRDTGETKRIPLPPNCNNIYTITSSQ